MAVWYQRTHQVLSHTCSPRSVLTGCLVYWWLLVDSHLKFIWQLLGEEIVWLILCVMYCNSRWLCGTRGCIKCSVTHASLLISLRLATFSTDGYMWIHILSSSDNYWLKNLCDVPVDGCGLPEDTSSQCWVTHARPFCSDQSSAGCLVYWWLLVDSHLKFIRQLLDEVHSTALLPVVSRCTMRWCSWFLLYYTTYCCFMDSWIHGSS
jgi:hypothetical protein